MGVILVFATLYSFYLVVCEKKINPQYVYFQLKKKKKKKEKSEFLGRKKK